MVKLLSLSISCLSYIRMTSFNLSPLVNHSLTQPQQIIACLVKTDALFHLRVRERNCKTFTDSVQIVDSRSTSSENKSETEILLKALSCFVFSINNPLFDLMHHKRVGVLAYLLYYALFTCLHWRGCVLSGHVHQGRSVAPRYRFECECCLISSGPFAALHVCRASVG